MPTGMPAPSDGAVLQTALLEDGRLGLPPLAKPWRGVGRTRSPSDEARQRSATDTCRGLRRGAGATHRQGQRHCAVERQPSGLQEARRRARSRGATNPVSIENVIAARRARRPRSRQGGCRAQHECAGRKPDERAHGDRAASDRPALLDGIGGEQHLRPHQHLQGRRTAQICTPYRRWTIRRRMPHGDRAGEAGTHFGSTRRANGGHARLAQLRASKSMIVVATDTADRARRMRSAASKIPIWRAQETAAGAAERASWIRSPFDRKRAVCAKSMRAAGFFAAACRTSR